MRWIAFAFGLLLICFSSIQQTAAEIVPPTQSGGDATANQICHYSGDIGGTMPIGVMLQFSDSGKTATGSYFYYKYFKDIRLEATISGRLISMREFDAKGNQTGRFSGEFAKTDPRYNFAAGAELKKEVIVGEWSQPDGSERKPFYLSAEFSEPDDAGNSYSGAGFDNDAFVDRFASRFRKAVLAHEVVAVTKMIHFPIKVTIDGKRRPITGPEDFRRNYDKIFSPTYVSQIADAATTHMFSRDQGVMLGSSGEVWIAPVQIDGAEVPAVIALNNNATDGHSIEAILGDWKVTKVAGFARISAMDEKEASKWIGSRATFTRELIRFDAPSDAEPCVKPVYSFHTVSVDEFNNDNNAGAKDLGLPKGPVTYVDIASAKNDWIAPGNGLILKSYGCLLTEWNGVYFELKRNDPAIADVR